MHPWVVFGETVAGYPVPVFNEREVRAAAGILFLLALVAFMHAWLQGDFYWTRLFVIAFVVDFSLRLGVSPRLAPSLVLGRSMVRKQTPEYVGAAQKRFAWLIGFALAVPMLYLIVINQVVGPLNLGICLACLTLMYFESVFGICIGCTLYAFLVRKPAQLCPGEVCSRPVRHDIQKIGQAQIASLVVCIGLLVLVGHYLPEAPMRATDQAVAAAAKADCTPPAWAVQIGHAEMWKKHHECP